MFDKLLLVFLVFFVFMFIFKYSMDANSLDYVKSDIDGDFHLVRDMPDKEEAADVIAEIKKNIHNLIVHLKQNFPQKDDVIRLVENFNENNIRETDMLDSGTSYSVNKGSELSLCIRDKNDENYKLHRVNLIMFVVIHELAHIASKSYGHNEEFGENFVFLLKEAQKIGVYSSEDYSKNNQDYCGIKITANPLA